MNMKVSAFAAAAVLFLTVPVVHAQTAAVSQDAAAQQAPTPDQERHQRVFGTTPDLNCIDGACVRRPTVPNSTPAPAQTPAAKPAATPGTTGTKTP